MSLDELLGAVPEGWDGLDVFVERKNERVLLLVVLHKLERIVGNVTEELDARLDTPVPLVIHQQGMPEEEARLISAHVAIGDAIAVDDLLGSHLLSRPCSVVLIDKVGEGPMLLGDLAILGLARGQSRGDLFELIIEGLIVEKDPVIVVGMVEAVLDLTNGAGNLPDVAVASEGDKGSIHTLTRSSRTDVGNLRVGSGVGRGRGRGRGVLGTGGAFLDVVRLRSPPPGRRVFEQIGSTLGVLLRSRRRGGDEEDDDEALKGKGEGCQLVICGYI